MTKLIESRGIYLSLKPKRKLLVEFKKEPLENEIKNAKKSMKQVSKKLKELSDLYNNMPNLDK